MQGNQLLGDNPRKSFKDDPKSWLSTSLFFDRDCHPEKRGQQKSRVGDAQGTAVVVLVDLQTGAAPRKLDGTADSNGNEGTALKKSSRTLRQGENG